MNQTYWAEAESMRTELYRVARGRFALPHDDAQDVAQRTIIQTATHLQEPKALKEFAHRTMRRMVIDRWRSRSQNELPIVIDEEGWQAHAQRWQKTAGWPYWSLGRLAHWPQTVAESRDQQETPTSQTSASQSTPQQRPARLTA